MTSNRRKVQYRNRQQEAGRGDSGSGHESGHDGQIDVEMIRAFFNPVNDGMTVEEFREQFGNKERGHESS